MHRKLRLPPTFRVVPIHRLAQAQDACESADPALERVAGRGATRCVPPARCRVRKSRLRSQWKHSVACLGTGRLSALQRQASRRQRLSSPCGSWGRGPLPSGNGSRHAPAARDGPATVRTACRTAGIRKRGCWPNRGANARSAGNGTFGKRGPPARLLNDLCPGCVQREKRVQAETLSTARSLAGSKRCQGALSRRRSRRFPRTCVPDASFLIKARNRPQLYFASPCRFFK